MQGSRARSQLADTTFADVRWVDETASTNDDVLALARAGAPEGVVVVADHQTAGRGRLDREWVAPPASSLLVSVLLRPKLEPARAHLTSTAVALAAADACEAVAGASPRIKWPNDLLLDDRSGRTGKVGGVLAESIVEGGRLDAVVVGMGLNVNWPAMPPELADIAVALNHVVGRELDREELLVAFLRRLDHWYGLLDDDAGRTTLIDAYRQRCDTIGARVLVDTTDEQIEGVARDVTTDGHLIVDTEQGEREIVTGDVVTLRNS